MKPGPPKARLGEPRFPVCAQGPKKPLDVARSPAHYFAMSRRPDNEKPWIVWRMTDGKAGHNAQSVGLVAALGSIHPVEEHVVTPRRWPWRDLLLGRFAAGAGLPDPDLIIGAGRTTHLGLIAARRARGGRSIVLMKPSVPAGFFDLCIVPEHDGVAPAKNVLVTKGVLNAVRPADKSKSDQGLILIGGPSKHFDWCTPGMVAQVAGVAAQTPSKNWTLTTSRRTPAGFLQEIGKLQVPNLRIVPVEATQPGWVAREMADANEIWVSEDSVSMIYEALSSGAGVGLLASPKRGKSRVSEGVRDLLQARMLTAFADWRPGERLPVPFEPFAEADRCARWIARHLLDFDQ